MDWVKAFGDYVPLFQTIVWIGFILAAFRIFRDEFQSLFEAITQRVKSGSSLKAGIFELGADLRALTYVTPQQPTPSPPAEAPAVGLAGVEARVQQREETYEKSRDVFVAHVLTPSTQPGQRYDIYIYLVRHQPGADRPADFSDVAKAEFFFGSYWGNHIFEGQRQGARIGVSTSAWGPFLCTCLVTFKDGYQVMLERYIDFEMAQVMQRT